MSKSAHAQRKTWKVRPVTALLVLFAAYLVVDVVMDFYFGLMRLERMLFEDGIAWELIAALTVTAAFTVFAVLTSFLVLIFYSGAAPPTGVRRSMLLSSAGIVLALLGVRAILGFRGW